MLRGAYGYDGPGPWQACYTKAKQAFENVLSIAQVTVSAAHTACYLVLLACCLLPTACCLGLSTPQSCVLPMPCVLPMACPALL